MTSPADSELWRPHPSYAHLQVSTHGRVINSRTGNEVGKGRTGGRNKDGYFAVAVEWFPESRTNRVEYVHTLVLETFVSPRPDGHDADHIDHNRSNNHVSNLRWRPIPENRADTSVSGGRPCPQGHEFTSENFGTYTDKNGYRGRYCRVCARDRMRARYRRSSPRGTR